MAGRVERVHPSYYDPNGEISEPVSPTATDRSTATNSTIPSHHPNYHPLKAYTTPGYESPNRPPPTEIGRPPLLPAPIPNKNPRKARRKCCRRCLLTCCVFLLVLLFLLGLATLLLWLLFKPRIPHYSVQDVRVTTLNVTTTTSSTSFADTDMAFTVRARNPNSKIRVDYKRVTIRVTYDGAVVGQGSIPGWFQEVRNTTVVTSEIAATRAPLTVAQGASLVGSIQANEVALRARVGTRVAVKMGAWLTPAVWVRVVCDVRVAPPTSAPAGGAGLLSKKCEWEWKPWKKG